MTKPLRLDSLEIKNFRVFRHLRIERLGRVNLIVGKNGVGKTCLLEALRLYAHRGSLSLIGKLLSERDESQMPSSRTSGYIDDQFLAVRHMFHGRKSITEYTPPIEIGILGTPFDTLSIAVDLYVKGEIERGKYLLDLPIDGDVDGDEKEEIISELDDPILCITAEMGNKQKHFQRLDQWDIHRDMERLPKPGIHHIFMPASGLDEETISRLWYSIALTDFEKRVTEALQIITPEIERLSLMDSQQIEGARIPVVKMRGADPLPLRSLGGGMNHLFKIALALVNAKDGMLLIDEIDNGLHYSVQQDMWRLVFRTAEALNVQVFATTHGLDCVEAFGWAAQEAGDTEGQLFRLQYIKDNVVAIPFDAHEVGIAAREQIEVR